MIKHIAGSGIKQGQWVACGAEKQCRLGGLHVSAEVVQNIKTELRSRGLKVNLADVTEDHARAWLKAHPDTNSWESKDLETSTLDKLRDIEERFQPLDSMGQRKAFVIQGGDPEAIEMQTLEDELKNYENNTDTLKKLIDETEKVKQEISVTFEQDKTAYEKVIGNKKYYSHRQHEALTPGYNEARKNFQETENLYKSAIRLSTAMKSFSQNYRKNPVEIGKRIYSLKTNTAIKELPERYLTHSDRFSDVGIDTYNKSVTETMNNKELSYDERNKRIQELRAGLKETAKFNFQSDVNFTKDSLKNRIANLFERAVSHKTPNRGGPVIITSGEQRAEQDELRKELQVNQHKLVDFFNRLEKAPIHSLITRSSREETLRNMR